MSSSAGKQASFETLRAWVVAIALILSLAATLYFIVYLVDFYLVAHRTRHLGLFELFVGLSPNDAANVLNGMPEVLAAILGLMITVASIVVQLAATAYTPRITDMFIRDRLNLSVMGYYIVATIYCLWISYSVRMGGAGSPHFVPTLGVLLNSVFMTIAMLLMAPYFAYVFHFLQPENVVIRLRRQTVAQVEDAVTKANRLDARQARVLEGIEQLADVALNTIQNKDKIIASRSVDALRELCVEYLSRKQSLPAAWFFIGSQIGANPDFVALTEERREDIDRQHTWVEYKILRQYQMLYAEGLNRMRDINYLLAIDTRYIGESAIEQGDEEVLRLAIKFFNTYLRATLNARDIRTAYNILNQYRILTEGIIRGGLDDLAGEVAGYFKYYGQLAFGMKLSFVTECVAYDLCTLNELAHRLSSPSLPTLLEVLLEVDKEAEAEVQETSLRGVRKAQIKLATYFLLQGEEALARQIYLDMKDERPDRLRSIRSELLAVDSKDFWEIIDRGENFDYLVPERKEKLKLFFSWFPEGTVG